jgi:hypothetical protein
MSPVSPIKSQSARTCWSEVKSEPRIALVSVPLSPKGGKTLTALLEAQDSCMSKSRSGVLARRPLVQLRSPRSSCTPPPA